MSNKKPSNNSPATYLVLVRHGKSLWNEKGLWTGWTDVDLHKDGIEEAKKAGHKIRDIKIHTAHVSKLKRAKQTFDHMVKTLKIKLNAKEHKALNERHYGIYTGKNKWKIKEEIGEKKFNEIRRGWDIAIPKGESMKDVFKRIVPYYKKSILKDIKSGKNTLVVAHGNSLRALIKHIDGMSNEDLSNLELGTGEIYCYGFDTKCNIISKEIRI